MRLYRVIVPVPHIDQAAVYYESLLGLPGKRVSSGRHYLDCEGTILALFSPREDTDPFDPRSNQGHLYLAVDDLAAVHERALGLGHEVDETIETRPWGERSFYLEDPFGNPLCMVDQNTLFTG
ncbi:VOC family protein [Actinopolymorpha pittospori]|uniref:Catechol 2,3-dioxygenase-like lactoylglutathione lyase family enzyme n=1 Tax=Actinopolymorpha pittospori TaxID=648752 RepID=A0A927RQA8_9ACTN|nr:VOC family protein [Actinopolymorpha pittospori]MBE1612931.1 catechol 2,3-dioxygenase-like lactoylglutathione lyase family enzyme [Actinopolymorpha pittospori]